MNRIARMSVVVAAVGGVVLLAYWGGAQPLPTASAPLAEAVAAEQASGEASERKILYYRNPMGLPDTSPVPKKDSMGMDYIPVYEGEGGDDAGAVTVSPARLQTLGVKTAAVDTVEIDAAVRVVGRVEINERAIHDVAPRFGGWIERLYVNATGDPVRRGQALFSVYSPELVSARKELAIARRLGEAAARGDAAAREGARRLAEAASERLRNWNMPDNARTRGDKIEFTAPASGVVLEKKAVAGMRFMPGDAIYRIADLSTVWVIADVYEQALARVAPGQRAEVYIEAFPDKRFEAKVTYLYPTLNAPTRTTPVRLELANPEGILRPGMFAHVDLAVAGSEPRLAVPASAIIDRGEQQVVLVSEGEGRFLPKEVSLGIRGRDHVEILEGLDKGERVVVAANFMIDSESNLKAALASFTEPQESSAKEYETTGSIDELYVDENLASMNHDPIPALQWPAMTMEFGMESAEVFKGIAPGEPIRFRFEDRGNGEFVITGADKVDAGNGER